MTEKYTVRLCTTGKLRRKDVDDVSSTSLTKLVARFKRETWDTMTIKKVRK